MSLSNNTPTSIKRMLEHEYSISPLEVVALDGYDCTNFKIKTSERLFFLRRYKEHEQSCAEYHVKINTCMSNAAVPVAKILPTLSTEYISYDGQSSCILQQYINDPLLLDVGITSERLRRGGQVLAQMHQCSSALRIQCPYEDILWNFSNFETLLDYIKQSLQIFPDEDALLFKSFEDEWHTNKTDWSTFHHAFLHNDFHSRNLMYNGNVCSGVIDFTESMPGVRLWDIASAIQYFLYYNDNINEVVASLLDGYQRTLPLDKKEMKYLALLVKSRAIMSYALNRIEQGRLVENPKKLLLREKLSDELTEAAYKALM